MEYQVTEQPNVPLFPCPVNHFARKDGRINVRAFEPLVPVKLIIDDPLINIFLPE
jgi:hypothetical protein